MHHCSTFDANSQRDKQLNVPVSDYILLQLHVIHSGFSTDSAPPCASQSQDKYNEEEMLAVLLIFLGSSNDNFTCWLQQPEANLCKVYQSSRTWFYMRFTGNWSPLKFTRTPHGPCRSLSQSWSSYWDHRYKHILHMFVPLRVYVRPHTAFYLTLGQNGGVVIRRSRPTWHICR